MANSPNMTSTAEKTRPSGPRLPQELMDLVLRNVDDEVWLWVVGRQVSHEVRKETERIFLEGLLRDAELLTNAEQHTYWFGLRYRCPFSRVSVDGATAFFSIVDSDEFQDMFDHRKNEECEALRPRFASYLNDAGCPLDGVDRLIKCDCREWKDWTLCMRMNELIRKYDLKTAKCRGQTFHVEDPGSWGWKTRGRRKVITEPRWYNNAWEDPADGGRITMFEDPLVVELESMAKAWEKGLY
ncbi:hypothetical protein BKA63DRAFT_598812 [Paraphoma chrysanthemicola]|nr:hypothetical protein BKA63DRAFT_598812 [Paraphoma chrysanthemicola]